MQINLTKFFSLVMLLSFSLLPGVTLQEAERNLDLGNYLVAEYHFNELLEAGDDRGEVLEGLALCLLNQEKYPELITLSHKYSNSSQNFNRAIAYSFFQKNNYQTSFYYYDKAVKADEASLIDISGRAWSAYYLGNYSLAYADFTRVHDSEYQNSSYDGLGWMEQNWKSNYSEFFVTLETEKTNYNFNYGFSRPNYGLSVTYNLNDTKLYDREMMSLLGTYKVGKFSFDAATMYADGDYDWLYSGYGIALRSNYLNMYKNFQSTISIMAGYASFEHLSSQQVRLDYAINNSKLRLSNGVSYVCLDYDIPGYDKEEFVYHGSISYKLLPYMSLSYNADIGESNFAYNDLLVIYDNFNVKNILQSVGLTFSIKNLTTYVKLINKDFESKSLGVGVGYVF